MARLIINWSHTGLIAKCPKWPYYVALPLQFESQHHIYFQPFFEFNNTSNEWLIKCSFFEQKHWTSLAQGDSATLKIWFFSLGIFVTLYQILNCPSRIVWKESPLSFKSCLIFLKFCAVVSSCSLGAYLITVEVSGLIIPLYQIKDLHGCFGASVKEVTS